MNKRLRFSVLAGLAMISAAGNSVAAEGKVYDLKGWKIRVTPAFDDAPVPSKPFELGIPVNPSIPAKSDDAVRPASDRSHQILIRPIVFHQAAAEEKPAPVPIELAPKAGIPPEPMPIIPNNGLSQPEMPVSVQSAVEPRPGCCGLPAISPRPFDGSTSSTTPTTLATQAMYYESVYRSIPFIRSEYRANPSYRHDATMEFLFGQMRQTIVQRPAVTVDSGYYDSGYFYPDQPYYPYSYGLRIHRSR